MTAVKIKDALKDHVSLKILQLVTQCFAEPLMTAAYTDTAEYVKVDVVQEWLSAVEEINTLISNAHVDRNKLHVYIKPEATDQIYLM